MFIKKEIDSDYTDTVRDTYKVLSSEFGYSAKITEFWKLFSKAIGTDKFEIIDATGYDEAEFEAYLTDTMVSWKTGGVIDFSDIYKQILKLSLPSSERLLLEDTENIEERIWAIYLTIIDPTMDI